MEDIPEWVSEYIGLEFESRGRGPDKFDCWGLVVYIYQKQFNIKLPSYVNSYTDAGNARDVSNLLIVAEERLNWINILKGQERTSDLILLRMKREPMHIGLIVAKNTFIHIHAKIGSVLQRYDQIMWEKRVIGFYRHISMTKDI